MILFDNRVESGFDKAYSRLAWLGQNTKILKNSNFSANCRDGFETRLYCANCKKNKNTLSCEKYSLYL